MQRVLKFAQQAAHRRWADGMASRFQLGAQRTQTAADPLLRRHRVAGRFGGDQLLVQDMMKHTAMLLEVEPGITTQFDMTGLAHEIEKVRTPKRRPILEASQAAE